MRAQLFLFCFMSGVGWEECSKLLKRIIFSVFIRLGPFPQLFMQVKDCLILQLHEIIRVPYSIAWAIFVFGFMSEIGR